MIIKRLEVEGIGIIEQPIKIDFPTSGKIGIFGDNETGKSTLLESIAVALFGLKRTSRTREDLVTWGKDRARLTMDFAVGEEEYRVEREIQRAGRHKARLLFKREGTFTIIERTVEDVQNRIEQITGLDPKTFDKLVYIKQKDLDALRTLARSDREQLINRMIGIEQFGEADQRILEDKRELKNQLERAKNDYEGVRKSKERFQELQKDLKEYEQRKRELESAKKEAEKELTEKELRVKQLEWHRDIRSLHSLIDSKKENISNLEQQRQRKEKLEEEIRKLNGEIAQQQGFIDQYREDFNRLGALQDAIQNLNAAIAELIRQRDDAQNRVDELHRRTGMTLEEAEQTLRDLPNRKQRALRYSMIFGAITIIALILGLTIHLLLLIGLLAGIPAYVSWRTYRRLDQFATDNQELVGEARRLEELNEQIQRKQEQKKNELRDYGFEEEEEIERQRFSILRQLEERFEVPSFDALDQKLQSNTKDKQDKEAELAKLKKIDFEREESQLSRDIQGLQAKLKEREAEIPEGAESIEYSEEALQQALEGRNEAKGALDEVKNDLSEIQGQIKEAKRVLDSEEFQNLESRYEQAEQKVRRLEYELEVLDLTRRLLKETSQQLRSQVIPYAKILIESILPIITDNRYFKLEIQEDFTFSAYTSENVAKPRDLFSGGTQDQFLIALRLAFAHSVLDSRRQSGTKYSLLMDECISSSDAARKKGIFAVLENMKHAFAQIFIIAHEDISHEVDFALHLERSEEGYTKIKSKKW
jgi:exonuclease SbcC